jgi:SAM-dependent MidA family methyltransferase
MSVVRSTLPPPDAVAAEHSGRVAAHLAQSISAAGGWIPFDRYMELVLYAPGLGYYAAGARKFGDSATGGDFVTAPEISPLFARARGQFAELFRRVPARIVGFGAGSGVLARDLLAALAAAIRSALFDRQCRPISWPASAICWQRPGHWLASPASFEGVMLANEVLDVMPVKLFVNAAVRLSAGSSCVTARSRLTSNPPVRRLPSRSVDRNRTRTIADGFTSEIGLVGASWMRSVGAWLGAALLAIDYGFPAHSTPPHRLMNDHGRAGTMHMQIRSGSGLCVSPPVDFSALADAARRRLDVLGYVAGALPAELRLLEMLQADHGAPAPMKRIACPRRRWVSSSRCSLWAAASRRHCADSHGGDRLRCSVIKSA